MLLSCYAFKSVTRIATRSTNQQEFHARSKLPFYPNLNARQLICGLASSKADEIIRVAEAIAPAESGRIHTYTPVNLKNLALPSQEEAIATIEESVSLARDNCDDVEWSAFDASRSDRDFLCRCIEAAIDSGATTVSIPDSLGVASPEEFSQLIAAIVNRVPNIDKAIISVHCHDDRGMAVENSIAALDSGARQI